MHRPLRSLLLLLTALAAVAAGALNGRVLCMAGEGHVAVEAPHAAGGHSGCCVGHDHDHGHGGTADDADGEHTARLAVSGSLGGCVDVHPEGTLVRQAGRPGYDHQHPPVAPVLLASVVPADVCRPPARGAVTLLRSDGGPPDVGDLASLRTIVLTI